MMRLSHLKRWMSLLFSKGVYRWAPGSTLGSYFVSATASHYDWAMKKLKAHQKNCKSKKPE